MPTVPDRSTPDPYLRMLRGAGIPTLAAGVAAVVIAAVVQGTHGAVGAGLGAVVVLIFFAAGLLALRGAARLQPELVMGVALLTYVLKVAALGVFLVLFSRASWLSGPALALTVVACTIVWLSCEIRSFTRLRLPVFVAPDTEGS